MVPGLSSEFSGDNSERSADICKCCRHSNGEYVSHFNINTLEVEYRGDKGLVHLAFDRRMFHSTADVGGWLLQGVAVARESLISISCGCACDWLRSAALRPVKIRGIAVTIAAPGSRQENIKAFGINQTIFHLAYFTLKSRARLGHRTAARDNELQILDPIPSRSQKYEFSKIFTSDETRFAMRGWARRVCDVTWY